MGVYIIPGQGHEVMFLTSFAHDFLDLGERFFGEKHLVIAPGVACAPCRWAISWDASGSCFRADHILIESEHSMAREDRDGSGIEMGFIAKSPVFLLGSIFRDAGMGRTQPPGLSLTTGVHKWVNIRW